MSRPEPAGRSRKRSDVRHACPHPGCGKTFARQDHLRRHTANHDPQRLKTCPECGRGFARGDVLAAHVKKHELNPVAMPERSPSPPVYPNGAGQPHPADAAIPPIETFDANANFESLYQWLSDGIDHVQSASSDLTNAMYTDALFDPTWLNDLPPMAGPSDVSTARTRHTVLEQSHQLALISYLSTLPELATDPSFGLERLSLAMERYWNTMDTQCPVIHRPTFDPAKCTGLVGAVVTAGLSVSEDEHDRSLAIRLYRHLRPLLLLYETSNEPASLPAFQALAILGQVGQMLLGRHDHELSYPYSAFDVTLGRSIDLFSWRFFAKMAATRQKTSLATSWVDWSIVESWRRVAHCILLRDIQLCSVFQQLPTRALSILFVRLTLPCSDDRWYAVDAGTWQALAQPVELPFPQAIKTALDPKAASVYLNPFARFCLVHGLMSVAWDVKWRGTLRASALESVSQNWRASILAAYRRLRVDAAMSLDLPFLTATERGMSRTTIDLLLIAELDMLADLTTILTFAGVDRIAARNIGPEDFVTAGKSVRKFALSDEGISAAIIAADYLRSYFTVPPGETPLFAPWATYLATLVLWSVTTLRESPQQESSASVDRQDPGGLLTTFPRYWSASDVALLLQTVSSSLAGHVWEMSREAATVVESLIHRKL